MDRLPTRVNLESRGIPVESNSCVLCGLEEEFESHVFFSCMVAWRVWCLCSKWIGMDFVYHWDARSHFTKFYLCWACGLF